MDFTLKTYSSLISALVAQGFSFSTFREFISNSTEKVIIFRHDVDLLPMNSLQFAKIQAEKGIKGTYYFRITKGNFNEKIIMEIHSLGHEIGYHYEDLSFAWAKLKAQRRKGTKAQGWWKDIETQGRGDEETERLRDEEIEKELADIAIESFAKNLKRLREIAPVKTICMHGSPMSKWDSRLLWKYYDYHDFGIIGEPYFDLNFDEVLYLTDTGRRWDGESVSVRDKIPGTVDQVSGNFSQSPRLPIPPSALFRFHSTFDIIQAAERGELPDKIMMTFHPQRWTDKPIPWVRELIWQNVKNVAKYFVVKLVSE